MKAVLLSFDIEEFDMPFEYGKKISFEKQIEISRKGTEIILDILRIFDAQATFFSTVVFAQNNKSLIKQIAGQGHEISSHGYYHSKFDEAHLALSRAELEKISGQRVKGFRMPRMMPVKNETLIEAGYEYNTSLNPTFLPGRYNNLSQPRVVFNADGLIQLPASVTPLVRFPLFWLSFHNLPLWIYKRACVRTINNDGYLNLYFHPWEFTDLSAPELGMPSYVRRNSGMLMADRFTSLLAWMKGKEFSFQSIDTFLAARK